MNENQLSQPKTYFNLIQMVGSKGRYQTVVFLIFCLNWFIAGTLLLGTSFLFMDPSFNCGGTAEEVKQCQAKICAKNPQEWDEYLNEPFVESLATQFGPYLCEKKDELNVLRMVLYIGTFSGYMIFLFITDNFGRKISIVAAWGVTTFGVLLLCVAQNMTTACFGLFFAGAGCESCIRISMAIFGEIVDYYKRQTYSVALEIAFGFSGVFIGVVYWIFRKWRIINILFCGIPCVIELLLLIFYLEETPKFLLTKKPLKACLQSLNRVGKINKSANIVSQEHIRSVLQEEEGGAGNKYDFIITPLHLFKFKSLRGNTICCSLIFMFITYLYFGPIVIMDKLGINPFIAQILVSSSELFAYPFAMKFIQKIPRIRSGYVCFGLALLFNGVLLFVRPGQNCDGCTEGIIEIALVFASRFVISFFFSIFFLYVTEIFPLRARGLGFGISSAAGAIASSSGQYIFTELQDKKINPMIVFVASSIICIIILCFMDQTLNQPLEDEIKEILAQKKQDKNVQDPQSTPARQKNEIELVEQYDDISESEQKRQQKFSMVQKDGSG